MKGLVEFAVDSAFETNSPGAELFGVLAELDNAGISFGYIFFFEVDSHPNNASLTSDSINKNLLHQFLGVFDASDFQPWFCGFGTVKNFAEINAVTEVWPGVKQQLCWWHVKIAL
ncbi:hypothetical protein OnM2_051060 [Erysiphe neolycopersici]|uniref:MULE transposase domain-containing protein n=1 Tax=Erysiphe neolycopersici TaxID=212602 RepID=A0A420HSF9_9PEZI|nr:hypothetical protein OnM2_051060 [Erysiphe neolycopersici]